MKKCVILLSGGLDSATVLAIVAEKGYDEIHAISFNYSQRNAVELDKARSLVLAYNVKSHKIINLDLGSLGGSALTDKTINVPKYKNSQDLGSEIPLTYVPARNTIFLSYALGFAEIIHAYDIFLGIHATDYANYPDCRQEFINSFEHTANLATAAGVSGNKISFHAPLINMTKSEIVKTGVNLKVDYRNTVSCYDPNILAQSCGKCHACLIRLDAFKDNELVDPVEYFI